MKLISNGLAILLLLMVACNSKPRKQGENYLNPATYLRNELAALDSGSYSFTRELLHDSLPADTLAADTAAIRAEIRQFLIQELEPGNFERYFKRKEAYSLRIAAMVSYLEKADTCRSKLLCQYFGDEVEACGHCDVCVKQQKTNTHDLLDKIKSILLESEKTTEEILALGLGPTEKVLADLRTLLDEQQIIELGEGRLAIKKKG